MEEGTELLDGEEGSCCRICRLPATEEKNLFSPCKCSGSIKYVHQDCLLSWLKHSSRQKCEVTNSQAGLLSAKSTKNVYFALSSSQCTICPQCLIQLSIGIYATKMSSLCAALQPHLPISTNLCSRRSIQITLDRCGMVPCQEKLLRHCTLPQGKQ